MLATWYAGSREAAPDVAIYRAFFDEDRLAWTEPEVLVDRTKCSAELGRYVRKVGNSMVLNNGGRLWLFYSSVFFGGWSGSSMNYKFSDDGGLTWSTSRKLVLSPFFNLSRNVKNKGLRLEDGSLILPVYHELLGDFSEVVRLRPGRDSVTWETRKMTFSGRAIQPVLLQDGSTRLRAFFRNRVRSEEARILTSVSSDAGATWSGLEESTLSNPNSGFDMMRLDSGAYMGVINKSFYDRSNLFLVISHDMGRTWKALKVLENTADRDYDYPSISRGSTGLYHITYTYEKKRIKHVCFNEAWLKQMDASRD